MKRIVLTLGLTAIFLTAHIGFSNAQFFFQKPEQVGNPAPDFKLRNIKGHVKTLSEYRNGKKTIIFFWATWCPYCRRELKILNKQVKQFESQGIKLATIDVGEELRVVKRYVQKNKLEVEVFMDIHQEYAEKYSIVGLPTFFFVDENGIVKNISHSIPEDLDSMFKG